jgi:hypothetical protein
MKSLLIIVLLFSFSFADSFDDFSSFEQFEKQDKQEFNRLKKKAKDCINNWDFNCARDSLYQMKKYITTKKDSKTINNLWDSLYAEEDRKKRNEEAQRRANAKKDIRISQISRNFK